MTTAPSSVAVASSSPSVAPPPPPPPRTPTRAPYRCENLSGCQRIAAALNARRRASPPPPPPPPRASASRVMASRRSAPDLGGNGTRDAVILAGGRDSNAAHADSCATYHAGGVDAEAERREEPSSSVRWRPPLGGTIPAARIRRASVDARFAFASARLRAASAAAASGVSPRARADARASSSRTSSSSPARRPR
eukprot:31166-Pelagococcus_subviridis.AAC.7